MAETVVYGCDWCKEIVPKRSYSEVIDWGARVTWKPTGEPERSFDVCRSCARVFRAVSEGKFKR